MTRTPRDTVIPQLSLPYLIVIGAVVAVYGCTAVAALFCLPAWGWRRFLPVLSLLTPGIAAMGAVRFDGGAWATAYVASTLIAPMLLFLTLRRAWSGQHWMERTLRVSGVIVFGYFLYYVLIGGIP